VVDAEQAADLAVAADQDHGHGGQNHIF
jgi:hypothetical protein